MQRAFEPPAILKASHTFASPTVSKFKIVRLTSEVENPICSLALTSFGWFRTGSSCKLMIIITPLPLRLNENCQPVCCNIGHYLKTSSLSFYISPFSCFVSLNLRAYLIGFDFGRRFILPSLRLHCCNLQLCSLPVPSGKMPEVVCA